MPSRSASRLATLLLALACLAHSALAGSSKRTSGPAPSKDTARYACYTASADFVQGVAACGTLCASLVPLLSEQPKALPGGEWESSLTTLSMLIDLKLESIRFTAKSSGIANIVKIHIHTNNNGTVLNGPPVVSLAPLYELPAAPAGYLSIEPTPTETDIASGLTLSGSFDAAYFGGAAWDAKSVSEFKAGADAGSFYLNLHTAEYNKTPWGVLRGDIVSAPLSACAGLYVEEPATPTTNTRTRRLLQL